MVEPPSRPDDDRVADADLQRALTQLGRLQVDQPLGQFLQRVADVALECLPGVEDLSITVLEDGRARSAAFTSPRAAALDERQYQAGFGPCLDAAQAGTVVATVQTAPELYPQFAEVASRLGIRSTVSVGMPVPQRLMGALNLYSDRAEGLGEPTVRLARAFASYAAVSLANAAMYTSTVALADQMQQAMRSRAVIEQAKGVLVARLGIGADDAFVHLVRTSQETNTKLRDLAADVVARAGPRSAA